MTDRQEDAPLDLELDNVMRQLQEYFESEVQDDDDEINGDYERIVEIAFPEELEIELGCHGISVSYKILLEIIARSYPEESSWINRAVEEFYDGSDGDDHIFAVHDFPGRSFDLKQVATGRAFRLFTAERRAQARAREEEIEANAICLRPIEWGELAPEWKELEDEAERLNLWRESIIQQWTCLELERMQNGVSDASYRARNQALINAQDAYGEARAAWRGRDRQLHDMLGRCRHKIPPALTES